MELGRTVVPGSGSHGRGMPALIGMKRKDCVVAKDRTQAGALGTMHVCTEQRLLDCPVGCTEECVAICYRDSLEWRKAGLLYPPQH